MFDLNYEDELCPTILMITIPMGILVMKKIRPLSNQELSMYKTIAEQFGKPELTDGWRKKVKSDINSPSIT
jgi:hypothetical protein